MNILFFAIPIALFISLLAVAAFVYLVKSGQFDDLETPPRRILFDDIEGKKPEVESEIATHYDHEINHEDHRSE